MHLKKCHICLGSFGIHKYGLKQSSPLKVREYLAYGFPVIIGYFDFPISNHNLDFILKVNPLNLNFNLIKDFIEKYKYYEVDHSQIKNFVSSKEIEKEKLKSIFND